MPAVMRHALLLVVAMAACAPATPPAAAASGECVVLLHGMARTERSMARMARHLAGHGYAVANVGYPSRKHRIEVLAPLAVEAGLAECRQRIDGPVIHFVTHSLGGILVRQYAASQAIEGLGRVVMLAPPNQGSIAAERWRRVPGFGWLNGPAGYQLGKGPESVPLSLGEPSFEFAVIAGDRTIDPITSAMLDNPDDGRVRVAETRLEGMRDFRVVHASHAFMMRNREVIELTLHFLRHGRFPEPTE